MLTGPLRYPLRGADGSRAVLLGGILTSFCLFVLPVVLALGYCVAVARETLDGNADPPVFDDVVARTVDGVVAASVLTVYLLVPVLAGAAIVVVSGGIGALSGEANVTLLGVLSGVFLGLVVGLVLAVVAGYLAFAAVLNYARRDSVTAAFDLTTVVGVAATGEYFRGYVDGLLLTLLGGVVGLVGTTVVSFVAGVLGLVPVVGLLAGVLGIAVQWVLVSFVGFYFTVANVRAGALGLRTALES